MPTKPSRARRWIKEGKATPFWKKGVFCVRLNIELADVQLQNIAVGIDPGSKKEALTVKSAAHTYLNIQADAVTWVHDAIATRRQMRRGRRRRKCPHRKPRWANRAKKGIAPSIKARWTWKLRLCNWLVKMFPLSQFVVEDLKAVTKGQRSWDKAFSPLEVGKSWFYNELRKLAPVTTKRGYETAELRESLGLKKSRNKMSNKFDAHCVDSWVLANFWTGGHLSPDNTNVLLIVPLWFHRRQLHRLQAEAGNIRKLYGGTRSLGFKRGALVRHPNYGLTYVGGCMKGHISLHSLANGHRLCQHAKPSDIRFLSFNSWRSTSSVA